MRLLGCHRICRFAYPALTCAIIIATGDGPLQAQSATLPRAGFSSTSAGTPHIMNLGISVAVPSTHWRTGAIIGAVVGILFVNAMMDDEGSAVRRVGLSLAGGAVVMMPGALIGGLFSKRG